MKPPASRNMLPSFADRTAAPRAMVPRIEIRRHGVDVDPSWRAIVWQQVQTWAPRYPGLSHLRVTLTGGRHHRDGGETVSVHAAVKRRTLHATKRADSLEAAVRDALRALGRELETRRRRPLPFGSP